MTRDRQAGQDHAEWAGWYEAQGYERDTDEADLSAESFLAGMQAARDLAAIRFDAAAEAIREPRGVTQ